MKIDIITIFPEMFPCVFNKSIIHRAQQKKKLKINVHNLRDYTEDKHKKVDSPPFGGGAGMVFRCEPVFNAVRGVTRACRGKRNRRVILLSPQGKLLTQRSAQRYLRYRQLVLICGRYEGVDERIKKHIIDEELSIGDYVISGGELAAMVFVDALARLLPGVVGDYDSVRNDSFQAGLLDHPHYTKPRIFKGWTVPEVLLSGDHGRIESWRNQQAFLVTKRKRPELIEKLKVKETRKVKKGG